MYSIGVGRTVTVHCKKWQNVPIKDDMTHIYVQTMPCSPEILSRVLWRPKLTINTCIPRTYFFHMVGFPETVHMDYSTYVQWPDKKVRCFKTFPRSPGTFNLIPRNRLLYMRTLQPVTWILTVNMAKTGKKSKVAVLDGHIIRVCTRFSW